MDEEDLIKTFGMKNFEKGKAYFKDGRVIICVKIGDNLYGYVYGTRRYKVRLNIKNLRDNECSCPVSYSCKHVVALGLSFIHGSYINGDEVINNFFEMSRTKQKKILRAIISRSPLLIRFFMKEESEDYAKTLINTMLSMCRSDMPYEYPERYVDKMYNLMNELAIIKMSDKSFSAFIDLFTCIWHQEIGYGFDEVLNLCAELLEKNLNERRASILAEKIVNHIYEKYQIVKRKEIARGWISKEESIKRSLTLLLRYIIKVGSKYKIGKIILQKIEKDKKEISKIANHEERERINNAIDFIQQIVKRQV